jgi:LPS export ABC transporter protein LptC
MNINLFFSAVILGLMVIFFTFKPLNVSKRDFGEIALFELNNFKLIELNNKGLTTVMNGTHGVRFNNRYEVLNINFTDNTKKYLANMLADKGIYKENNIELDGNINYTREDGITFLTQKATYNKESSIVHSPSEYTALIQKNKIIGSEIEYNNNLQITNSKKVTVTYNLKERKL